MVAGIAQERTGGRIRQQMPVNRVSPRQTFLPHPTHFHAVELERRRQIHHHDVDTKTIVCPLGVIGSLNHDVAAQIADFRALVQRVYCIRVRFVKNAFGQTDARVGHVLQQTPTKAV